MARKGLSSQLGHLFHYVSTLAGEQSSLLSYIQSDLEFKRAKKREYHALELYSAMCASLSTLIMHAAETVPFYQTLWRNKGVDPRQVKTPESLTALPIVTRSNFENQGLRQLLSTKSKRTKIGTTSGTTTTPRINIRDDTAAIYASATIRRYLVEYGIPVRGTLLFLHSRPNIPPHYQTRADQLWTRRVWASVVDLMASPETAKRLPADAVIGSPQQLEAVAFEVYRAHSIQPPAVFVSIAESLDAATRTRIEEATGSRVYDVYCCSELSALIGFECRERAGFHINSDSILVEVLDPDGEPAKTGEPGEVVVTDLHNYVSPLIRYKLGDVATVGKYGCDCGRALPLQISQIVGRATDRIAVRRGINVDAHPLIHALQNVIASPFTLVQEADQRFVLNCFYRSGHQTQLLEQLIRRKVNEYLKAQCIVEFRYLSLASRLRDGPSKIHPFVCRVPRPESEIPDLSYMSQRL